MTRYTRDVGDQALQQLVTGLANVECRLPR